MLTLLVEGWQFAVSEDQKKTFLNIVQQKLRQYRALTHETETTIWDAIQGSLGPERRRVWNDAYGDGALPSPPVSPVLLLYQSSETSAANR